MERNFFKKLKNVVFDQGKDNHRMRKSGIIKWLNREKGYGIVNYDRGGEVFVHYDPLYGKDYHPLRKDDQGDINVAQSKKEKLFNINSKQGDHRTRVVTRSMHYRGIK
jgi:cold shock CspA family protein